MNSKDVLDSVPILTMGFVTRSHKSAYVLQGGLEMTAANQTVLETPPVLAMAPAAIPTLEHAIVILSGLEKRASFLASMV